MGAQRLGESVSNLDSRLPQPALDESYVGAVKARPMGQSLLRESPSEALTLHDFGEGG